MALAIKILLVGGENSPPLKREKSSIFPGPLIKRG
jgi:hypothetical protein